jgi:hypothetical protein
LTWVRISIIDRLAGISTDGLQRRDRFEFFSAKKVQQAENQKVMSDNAKAYLIIGVLNKARS